MALLAVMISAVAFANDEGGDVIGAGCAAAVLLCGGAAHCHPTWGGEDDSTMEAPEVTPEEELRGEFRECARVLNAQIPEARRTTIEAMRETVSELDAGITPAVAAALRSDLDEFGR